MGEHGLECELDNESGRRFHILGRKLLLPIAVLTVMLSMLSLYQRKAVAQHPGHGSSVTQELNIGASGTWGEDMQKQKYAFWLDKPPPIGKWLVLRYTGTEENGDKERDFLGGIRWFPIECLEIKGVYGLEWKNDSGSHNTIQRAGGYATYRGSLPGSTAKVRIGGEAVIEDGEVMQRGIAATSRHYLAPWLNLILAGSHLQEDDENRIQIGGGGALYLPGNFYIQGCLTNNSDDDKGLTKAISIGRHATFMGEKEPTAFVIYEVNNQTSFLLAGSMIGSKIRDLELVLPAVNGMTFGIMYPGLPDMAHLRGFNNFGSDFTKMQETGDVVLFGASYKHDVGRGILVGGAELGGYWTFLGQDSGSCKMFVTLTAGYDLYPDFREAMSRRRGYGSLGFGATIPRIGTGLIRLGDHEEKGRNAMISFLFETQIPNL